MVTGVIEGSKYIQYTLYKILKDSLSHMYVCMYVSNLHVYIYLKIYWTKKVKRTSIMLNV